MAPALHYLFVLWLDWGVATGAWGEPMQVVQATESQRVFLSCSLEDMLASGSLELTWFGPSEEELLSVHVTSHHSSVSLGNAWSLQIHNITREDDVWFTCSWNGISGKNHTFRNRTGDYDNSENTQEEVKGNLSSGHKEFLHSEWHPESFPCDVSISNNWTSGSLLWFHNDLWSQKTVLNVTMWRSSSYWPWMRHNDISLLLPSVSPRDSGNYTCEVVNQTPSRYYWLEVTAKSASWLNFGDWHWIIWAVALGYMVVCFGFLFCFLRIQRSIRTHRQQKKLRVAARRRFFQAQRNRAHVSNGALVLSALEDGAEPVDAFSYENVMPTVGSVAGQQLLQKGNILPNATKMGDEDEEEYELPDSETEIKDAGPLYANNKQQGNKNLIQDPLAEDDDNYENTQEEVKWRDRNLCDRSLYENRKEEMKSGSCTWDSAGPLYANNTQKGNKNLIQESLAEDAANYENVEEAVCVSPGAARLIAGLQLALSSNLDRQDGGSEASTGSQSYEEMNGNLSPITSKTLHLHPNTSNEEDADSYENMESPNSFNSRKEGNLDPCGEGAAFVSIRQNLPIALGLDLRGGQLCSD